MIPAVPSVPGYGSAGVLGLPATGPLGVYDSRLVTTSGGNVTAWPDASGVRSAATVLAGTPTLSATAGPGGGPAVDTTTSQVFDAGATALLPVSGSWTLYQLLRVPVLDGVANYVVSQYLPADAGRSTFGYNAGSGNFITALRASTVVSSGSGATTAWVLLTYARSFGTEFTAAAGNVEIVSSDPISTLALANTGCLIGAIATTGAYNNSGALAFHGDALIAHISAWSGYHSATQRTAMRAAIAAGHGF